MPHYFMHLRDRASELLDEDGVDYSDVEAARAGALRAARDIMSADLKCGILDFRFRIDAEDATGTIVFSLPFGSAVEIIPD